MIPSAANYEGAQFWVRQPEKIQNPYADFDYFRGRQPIYFDETLSQWFAFRHKDISALFTDPRLSANRLAGMRQATPPEAHAKLDQIAPYFDSWILMNDGEKHRRIRGLLHAGFNAKVIESLGPNIQASAHALLDQVPASGQFDVCSDYAFLLTAYVLADFLGVHPTDRERVVKWSMDFIDYFNEVPITVGNTNKMVDSGLELIRYTQALLNARRAQPADDFLGSLVKVSGPGTELSNDELVGNAMLLLLAGHIAVRNFIGNTVWLLLEHPDQFQLLKKDPSLLSRAVEESLRFETPVAAIPRIVLHDFEYRGKVLREGQIIQLLLTSGNRDPEVFTEPDAFDITRVPGKTLSFGHGAHACLGSMLARQETVLALEILFQRMPGLALDPSREITWYRNLGNRGPIHLPVIGRGIP